MEDTEWIVTWIMQETAWNKDRAEHAMVWMDENVGGWRDGDFLCDGCLHEHLREIADRYFGGV